MVKVLLVRLMVDGLKVKFGSVFVVVDKVSRLVLIRLC